MTSYERVVEFADEGLGNASYLLDCGNGSAAVVDPARDVTPYLHEARRRELTIRFVLETHLHADFVSGATALAAAGAAIFASAAAGLEPAHVGLRHGDEFTAGALRIRAIATPGHTPEHLSYAIVEDGTVRALFSGGALLPGSVARTDLTSAELTVPLARESRRTLRAHLASLPDDVVVYPTHGGGSFCATAAGGDRVTTLGRERHTHPAFTLDEQSYVERLVAGYGAYPPYFLRLREVNRRGPTVDVVRTPKPLSAVEAHALVTQGAELVDVRAPEAWAERHAAGSLSIPLRPAFPTWLGWIVEIDRPLVFVSDEGQDSELLVRLCHAIGYDAIAGLVDGGIEAWEDAGLPVARVAAERIETYSGPLVDVRQASEFATGHVPGAVNVALGDLGEPPLDAVGVMCGHGERAATAASLLLRAGSRRVTLVLGGPQDWSRARRRALETVR